MNRNAIRCGLAAAGILWSAAASSAGLFSSTYGDFKDFVEEGKYDEAVLLIQKDPKYFAGLKEDKKSFVDTALARRDEQQHQQAAAAAQALRDAGKLRDSVQWWITTSQALRQARTLETSLAQAPLLGPQAKAGLEKLRTRIAKSSESLREGALMATGPRPRSGVTLSPATSVRSVELDAKLTPKAFVRREAANKRRLLMLVRVQPALATRIDGGRRTVPSQFVVGTRRVANPEHARLQKEIREAEAELKQSADTSASAANNIDANPYGALLVSTISIFTSSAASTKLKQAQEKLRTTPEILDEAVTEGYTYYVDGLKVERQHSADYILVDLRSGKVTRGSLQRQAHKEFSIPRGLSPVDNNRERVLAGAATLRDVTAFEAQATEDSYERIWAEAIATYQRQHKDGP